MDPAGGSGEWEGPGVLNNTTFSASGAGRGTHTLTYVHTLPNGCSDTAEREVSVVEEPDEVEIYNALATEDFDGVRLHWQGGRDNVESYEVLRATGRDGRLSRSLPTCTEQSARVFMPNSFSPGAGGEVNEVISPKGLHIATYEMTIYNRWGQKVYETTDAEPWDGRTPSGERAASGTYLYEAVIYGHDGQRINEEGTFHLMR